MRTRNKRKREVVEPSSDPATVLAIFAGVPHMVVTDKGFNPTTRSRWMNPFLATTKQETYFQS